MKKIRILLIALILILGGIVFSKTYAADETRSLGANMQRPFSNATYQYGVEGNTSGSMLYYTAVKIFDNADKDASNNLLYSNAFYCIRGGKGFGQGSTDASTDVSSNPIDYIQAEASEMHANAKDVITKYNDLYSINLDRIEKFKAKDSAEKDINIYNAILWILDESYLPKDKLNSENKVIYSSAEYKAELLDKAGVPTVQQKDVTDDDLEVIQQLAIWYFANYDEQKAGAKPTVSQTTMYPGQFLTINGNNNIDSKREENLNRIYQYLIYGAIDNSSSFAIDETTGARTKNIAKSEFDKTEVLKITSNDSEDLGLYKYYQIGPVKIANDVNNRTASSSLDASNIVLCDVNGNTIPKWYPIYEQEEKPGANGETIYGDKVHTGNHVVYRFVNEAGQEVTSLQEGLKYYIRFYKAFEKGSTILPAISEEYKYDVSKITLKMTSSYSLSTATFLYAKENAKENQAVVELEKEKISESDEITTKEFDLSLRKFITSINGEELTGANSRVPKIDTTTLINGITNRGGEKEYTATYTHPKNALQVKTNDKVIYTIRVYNEGELDGTATQVTDYLPSGLELVPASESTINTKYGWKASSDSKIIVTDYLKDKTLKAFDETLTVETAGEGWQKAATGVSGLYYADLQVECIVKAEILGQDQNLRNIAAITEDTGDDRDSVPGDPGRNDYNPPADNSTYKEDDDDYEDLVLPTKKFDLALRKYIVGLERQGNAVEIPNERELDNIDITKLVSGEKTTAEYKHRKDPVEVKTGDIVTYKFTVYNEGEIDGYVYSIVDYLPQGLTFDNISNAKFIEYKDNYEEEELNGKEYIYKIEENKITITSVNKKELFKLKAFNGTKLDSNSIQVKFKVTAEISNNDKVLTNVATMTYGATEKSAEEQTITDRDSNISGEEFNVPTAEKLLEGLPGYKGIDSNKNDLSDSTYHYKGQQDDDDFEKIIIKGKSFDLSLRKYIAAINGEALTGEESRVPKVDTSKLNTIDSATGKKITTAIYEHSKEPVTVKKGDLVTYKIRIYNEGQRDGYATKVTDYLPEGLGFLYTATGDINSKWILPENIESKPLYGEDGIYEAEENILKKSAYKEVFGEDVKLEDIQVIQAQEDKNGQRTRFAVTAGGTVGEGTKVNATDLIKAYGSKREETDLWQQSENNKEDGLFYQELEITCIVLKENTYPGILKNVAEITGAEDSEGNEIKNIGDDIDSEPDNVYADKEHKPGAEVDGYTPGEQDDDDFEPLQLRYFDLALRKFITGVETNGKTKNITSRIPVPKMGEDGNIVYEHTKDPVLVANNDTVIYTLRVYNEGTLAGYAEEITDDIPEGLEYLPEHSVNKQYEWVMIDKDGKITEKVEDAVKITTDYLSEEKETKSKMTITDETTGEISSPTNVRENLIDPFDSSKAISNKEPLNPDYKDIKVAFKVIEPNTSDRIIVNSAQISEDSDDDEDSNPEKWIEKEDDQDREYIYVQYFDLSLLKWVTQTIVTVDGKTTTTETGFEPNTGKTETTGIRDNEEAEPIAKVELDRKKLKKTTVKFVYNIKVTNEGEIAGYATEITDYIPEGLEFFSEDNKAFGWEKDGNNKVITRALETVLLQPGESATVKIVFRWKNDSKNLGLKTNIAEISEDYNEYNSKDIDSDPDNKVKPYEKEQEDDDDFALVILSIKTGKGTSYTILIMSMLTLLASGTYLIKKYVLDC